MSANVSNLVLEYAFCMRSVLSPTMQLNIMHHNGDDNNPKSIKRFVSPKMSLCNI